MNKKNLIEGGFNMDNLFWLSVSYGSNGYGFVDKFEELLKDVEYEFNDNIRNHVKEWALHSKKGDIFNQYSKYGMYIENLGVDECA